MGGRHWEGKRGNCGRRSDEEKEKGEMGLDSPIGETDGGWVEVGRKRKLGARTVWKSDILFSRFCRPIKNTKRLLARALRRRRGHVSHRAMIHHASSPEICSFIGPQLLTYSPRRAFHFPSWTDGTGPLTVSGTPSRFADTGCALLLRWVSSQIR